MIQINKTSSNTLEFRPQGPITEQDITLLESIVDPMIAQQGSLRLMIFSRYFAGWASWEAMKRHFIFVKTHHEHASRIAFITHHLWQKMLLAIAKHFLHAQIKTFSIEDLYAARTWLDQR